jgi:glycerophosphoryl diester phosphodiesterase
VFCIPFAVFAQVQPVLYFGHRGCRGLLPENSIESFQYAISLGVDGIELDVVVNKNKQLVISHEPYFQSTFCWDSSGNAIINEKQWNIYEMTQDEIEQFDCGSKIHPRFEEQKKIKVHKPLLQELFKKVDLSNTKILFEIKSSSKEYGKSQPHPPEFIEIIMNEISQFQYKENLIFMSFDAQILEEIYRKNPSYPCVYLTYLPYKSASSFLKQLTFKPFALGMYYPTIGKKDSKFLHSKEVKLFAWTVNSPKIQKKLIRNKVDGIITDYPDRIKKD